jgi:inner membrane protein involved in colicin E2 resistance
MTTNNHPAHGPVSLDRLHQIREILSKAAAQSDGGNLGYAMADAVKVIDEVLAARAETVKLPAGYNVRPGHPINESERGVMIPKDNGQWLSRFDVEHALRVAGVRFKED